MNLTQSIRTLILAFVLSIGISYAYAAVWSPPSVGPTGGNTDTPVNVGGVLQVKSGGLTVNGLFQGLSNVVLATSPGSKVGIGMASPIEKLDVAGAIHSSGDVCTDQGGGKCLSTIGGGGGLIKYPQPVYQCPVSPPPGGGPCSGGVPDLCSGQLSTVLTSCRQYTGGCLLSPTSCGAVGYIVQ